MRSHLRWGHAFSCNLLNTISNLAARRNLNNNAHDGNLKARAPGLLYTVIIGCGYVFSQHIHTRTVFISSFWCSIVTAAFLKGYMRARSHGVSLFWPRQAEYKEVCNWTGHQIRLREIPNMVVGQKPLQIKSSAELMDLILIASIAWGRSEFIFPPVSNSNYALFVQ